MARLNDPPAPAAESLDALKRRFIRQNREIARVNSSQSQRIRNLETEISRLLAENIAFREQAIRANEEVEKLQKSNRLGRDVVILKDKLDMKLGEVNALVEELGGLPEKAAKRTSLRKRRSTLLQRLIRSPDEKDWRNRQHQIGALNPEQEGRLPAIVEDKYYPRRTLDFAELGALDIERNNDVDSPDLGPPPIVHFDVNDPIAFDHAKSSIGLLREGMLDEDVIPLPSNLETRRKRRTSSLILDSSVQDAQEAASTSKGTEQSRDTRPGAKRKVDAYEFEKKELPLVQDDFVFQRKSTATNERAKPSRFMGGPQRQTDATLVSSTTLPLEQQIPSTRQVLAPKSTNSPAKRKVSAILGKRDTSKERDGKDPVPKASHNSAQAKARRPIQIELPLDSAMGAVIGNKAPKTPAADPADIMSPLSVPTEPSTKQRPMATPEMAVTNSVEDVLNGSIGRGSRRARAAVSYAEPNLRDKMRRPDKKLVGAVEGLNKPNGSDKDLMRDHKSASDDIEGAQLSIDDAEKLKHLNNLAETTAKSKWDTASSVNPHDGGKDEAISPLRGKERKQINGKRHKRTFSEIEYPGLDSHISKPTDDVCTGFEQLSIFDPPTSSPIATGQEISRAGNSRQEQKTTTVAGKSETTLATATGPKSRRHSIQVQQSLLGPLPARPSSALSLRRNAIKEASTTKLKRANSVQSISGTLPTPGLSDTSGQDLEPETGRTINTRRRSMMWKNDPYPDDTD